MALSKAALILWLLPSLFASPQAPAHAAAALSTPFPVRGTVAAPATVWRYPRRDRRAVGAALIAGQVRHPSATARAVERRLLLFAPRATFLRRFVDRTTGLVKRNVTAHCYRFRGKHYRHTLGRFFCRIWLQPRSRLSGVAVICHTRHHRFRVTVYHGRHRHNRPRRPS